MSDTIRFRDALEADAPAVAALHALSWRTAYRGILSDAYLDGRAPTERAALWLDRLRDSPRPDQIVLLAEDGEPGSDLPIAFACILLEHHPNWGSLVDNLHVRPDAKRRRLGRRVLREAALVAADRRPEAPVHLTVLEKNAPAIAAYESWGGTLAERLVEVVGGSGERHPVRRYAWPSPAELARSLAAADEGRAP